jgi:hypothetical protein
MYFCLECCGELPKAEVKSLPPVVSIHSCPNALICFRTVYQNTLLSFRLKPIFPFTSVRESDHERLVMYILSFY